MDQNKKIRTVVFARPPAPGSVKTRLAEFLGSEKARDVYLITLCEALEAAAGLSPRVYSASSERLDLLAGMLPEGAPLKIQQGNDLGERMAHALAGEARAADPDEIICLIGSDIPGISAAHIERAARLAADVVLGPAQDGGYWLIAAKASVIKSHNVNDWFAGISWSSPDVLEKQRKQLERCGFSVALTETLSDLDTAGEFFASSHPGISKLRPRIGAVLPVLNEAENLPFVLGHLNASKMFTWIVCVDNGSTDDSARIARELGAVVRPSERGYGNACLAGIEFLKAQGAESVLFIDADGADDPADVRRILAPVVSGRADFCLGRRVPVEAGALLVHARFGNWLSCFLIRLFWGYRFEDLGPLRALSMNALERLKMEDRNYGWTVEMQIRAVKRGLKIIEIPAAYRKRLYGASKVSSNLRGSILAGSVILRTVFGELWRGNHGEGTGKKGRPVD